MYIERNTRCGRGGSNRPLPIGNKRPKEGAICLSRTAETLMKRVFNHWRDIILPKCGRDESAKDAVLTLSLVRQQGEHPGSPSYLPSSVQSVHRSRLQWGLQSRSCSTTPLQGQSHLRWLPDLTIKANCSDDANKNVHSFIKTNIKHITKIIHIISNLNINETDP